MYTQKLIDFIKKSPTAFHATDNIANMIISSGGRELFENESWDIKEGQKYFVRRNSSSLIAFSVPKKNYDSFMMITSHTDSPSFKIKPNPDINTASLYTSLNCERYGGPVCSSWFDRPLSVAGRVIVDTDNGIEEKLINIDRDLVMIPSVAPHIFRSDKKKEEYDLQTELIPLFALGDTKDEFMSLVAKEAQTSQCKILGHDLFLYCRDNASIWGLSEEFFSAPRIDNLQCAYASVEAFLKAENNSSVNILAAFDNEEVGSGTKQGALSTFLYDVMTKINAACQKSEIDYKEDIASSMTLSADNAHAVHPNYSSKHDVTSRPALNCGVLIKHNASQKYTTDAMSAAILKKIFTKNNIPFSDYVNHSSTLGGSTLGHLLQEQVSMLCADIGAGQLSMHSAYETAGTRDTKYLVEAMTAFYNTTLKKTNNGYEF